MKNYFNITLIIGLMTITSCGNNSRTENKEKDNYEVVKESIDTAVHKAVDGVHKGADWVDGVWQGTKEGVVDGVHAVGDAVTDGVDEIKAEIQDAKKGAKEVRKALRKERQEARRKRNERKAK